MTNCSRECDRAGFCPFVRDPDRPTRYVCLKCGLDRDIRQFSFGDLLLGAIAVVIILLLLAGLAAGKKPPNSLPPNRDSSPMSLV
jgi:hypothetical protein